MDELAAALARLAEVFPDDAGPAADAFSTSDLFDDVLSNGNWAVGSNQAAFVDRLVSWTPRIMRLQVSGRLPRYSAAVPTRFVDAGWRKWPDHRRDAMTTVLATWWHTSLTSYPGTQPVSDVLVFLTQMTGDVRPWLATWSAIGGVAAAQQFHAFLAEDPDWSSELWEFDQAAATDTIDRWVLRDGIDILAALPPGPDLDTGLERLTEWENRLWHLWWPADQLT
jgi:hypothetical protein